MWKRTCMYTCAYGMCVWVQMCPSVQECKFVCCMCRCASKYVYLCRYGVCICVNVCAGMHVCVHSDEWEGYVCVCVCIGLQTFPLCVHSGECEVTSKLLMCPSLILHLTFFRRVSQWMWSSLFWLALLPWTPWIPSVSLPELRFQVCATTLGI